MATPPPSITPSTDKDALEYVAFAAGYHARWLRAEQRWSFDPAYITPSDPKHAFIAWKWQNDLLEVQKRVKN